MALPTWAGPPTLISSFKSAPLDMPIGQYDEGNSSIEAPSSSGLACTKLAETSQHMCLVMGTLVSHFTMVRNNNVNQSCFRWYSGMAALSGLLSDVRAVWGLSFFAFKVVVKCLCLCAWPTDGNGYVCVCWLSHTERHPGLNCIRMSEGVSLILGQLRH